MDDDDISVREDALVLFTQTFPDAGLPPPDADATRERVLNRHPDLVGEIVRSHTVGALPWLVGTRRFLTPERMPGDLETLYVAIRDSVPSPDVHQEAVRLLMDVDTHLDTRAYLKCKLAAVPLFPDAYTHADVWQFLEDMWGADDHWMVVHVLQFYFGMGNCFPPALEDVLELVALATRMLKQAPSTSLMFARLLELYHIGLIERKDDYDRLAAAIGDLNAEVRRIEAAEGPESVRKSFRARGPLDPLFHAEKCAHFRRDEDGFVAEWDAHLREILANPPPIPDDDAAAVRVLRRRYHVCHESLMLLAPEYLTAVEMQAATSAGGTRYMRLATRPKNKVRPIEFVVLDYLCDWAPGADHSTTTDVRVYIKRLRSRAHAQGRIAEFDAVIARRGQPRVFQKNSN
jgi:hypothetical protein